MMGRPLMDAGPRRRDGKDHFEVLDGLRGTAALLVVAFHIQGITVLFDAPRLLLPHAYLAVDFFFALSGFVVGYAYDDRWGTMSTAQFLRRRLIRLHPLVVLGAILGLLSYVADPFAGDRQAAPAILVMCAFVMAALALPSAPLPNRLGDSHPLNAPAWTLFQEYVGNLAYALVLRRLGTRALAVAVGVAGLLSAAMALTLGSYDTGWGLANAWGAPVRLAYPFMTGLLLFRLQDRLPRCRIGFVPLSVVLALAFAAPVWPAVGDVKLNGLYQALCVLVLFPAIIVLGRHSRGSPSIRRLCRAAGILSYPLYITHYPFVYLYMNWISNGHVASGCTIWVPAALFVFTVVFAFVAYRLWDLPLRRALQRRDGEPRGHL